MRYFLLFLLLLPTILALTCFYNIPTNTELTCSPSIKYCIKITNVTTTLQMCDGGICDILDIKSGKCKSKDGGKICCCDKDKCNSGRINGVLFTGIISIATLTHRFL